MSAPTGETKVAPTEDKSAQFRVSMTEDASTLVYERLVMNEETGRFEIETVEMQPNLFIAGKYGSGKARQLTYSDIIIGSYPNGMSRGLTRWVPPPPPPPPEEDDDDEEMPELVAIEPVYPPIEERKEAKPPSLD